MSKEATVKIKVDKSEWEKTTKQISDEAAALRKAIRENEEKIQAMWARGRTITFLLLSSLQQTTEAQLAQAGLQFILANVAIARLGLEAAEQWLLGNFFLAGELTAITLSMGVNASMALRAQLMAATLKGSIGTVVNFMDGYS